MERLLLPLIAALAFPTAVNAEVANYYLLGIAERETYVVPMQSLELCEEAGIKAVNPKEWYKRGVGTVYLSYVCLKAK